MERNEKISVVIPIYNVEEYLPRCLDSIIGQTYRNIEIILVDDGSPDNAGAICDRYSAMDSRIRVFHIPNGGVSKARELGVNSSTGEYIVFVDPDDWLPLDSVEILYSAMNDELDIVLAGQELFRSKSYGFNIAQYRQFSHQEYLASMFAWEVEIGPFSKLFRKALFSENSFPCVRHTEDALMNIDLAVRVRSALYIDKVVYNRFDRDSSATNTYKSSFEQERKLCLLMRDILTRYNLLPEYLVAYSKGAQQALFRSIIRGGAFDQNDWVVTEIYDALKNMQLTAGDRIRHISLRSSLLRSILPIVRNVKRFFAHSFINTNR